MPFMPGYPGGGLGIAPNTQGSDASEPDAGGIPSISLRQVALGSVGSYSFGGTDTSNAVCGFGFTGMVPVDSLAGMPSVVSFQLLAWPRTARRGKRAVAVGRVPGTGGRLCLPAVGHSPAWILRRNRARVRGLQHVRRANDSRQLRALP